MTNKQNIDINLIELVNMAAKILDQIFITAPKDKAKPVFKDIKQGKAFALGTVKIQELIESTISLDLDYSEFRGPGFNFDAFTTALRGILEQVSQKFQAKADLNIMTSEQGTILIHLPGMIQIGEQLNVMVMAFDLGALEHISIKLMFVEPDQYNKKKDAEQENVE